MAALVKVGVAYKATYSMDPHWTASVTAKVQVPSGGWFDLPLVEVPTPEGHDKLFTGDFVPAAPGWYVVSFDTDPTGGESMQKFYATDDWGDVADGGTGIPWRTFTFAVSTTTEV